MGPLLLAITAIAAFAVAAAILRSFGAGYRVGRLLAVVPQIPIAEALRLVEAGERRYVRIDGRIDSEAAFEDEHHRPLVLRRTRTEWRPTARDRWRPVREPSVELGPFVIREGLDEIEIEAESLAEGLVVVPRVSTGRVADLGDAAPADAPPTGEARIVVEQVSSVEHATILGVPVRGTAGRARIGPGLGRPLILTTLEKDEAMRVLTGGAARRSRLAIACLAGGAALLALAAIWWLLESLLGGGVAAALAASPDPTIRSGDVRPGGTPGFVGEPLLAILGVVGLGILSLLGTLAWIRLTGGRRPRD
ncbi:MAG TPA: hypothetical protein VNL94_07155 [Candidatus Binatia bacterium]|nr:hypothetical protein [Candidatus Binatia bacterium]